MEGSIDICAVIDVCWDFTKVWSPLLCSHKLETFRDGNFVERIRWRRQHERKPLRDRWWHVLDRKIIVRTKFTRRNNNRTEKLSTLVRSIRDVEMEGVRCRRFPKSFESTETFCTLRHTFCVCLKLKHHSMNTQWLFNSFIHLRPDWENNFLPLILSLRVSLI